MQYVGSIMTFRTQVISCRGAVKMLQSGYGVRTYLITATNRKYVINDTAFMELLS